MPALRVHAVMRPSAALTRPGRTFKRGRIFRRRLASPGFRMTKALSLLIIAAMILHLIKPLGLPGLRRRGDFWKLAVAAMAAISLTVIFSHGT